MNLNKSEVSLSSLDTLKPQLSCDTNKENYLHINNQKSQYIENNTETNMKHDNFEKSNIKKKYKKNLVWDGPRWDLAHFDPAMSARERKKLVYYDALFNKLENNVLLNCNEHRNKNLKNQNQKRRIRNNISDTNSKNQLDDLKEMKEKHIDHTDLETSSKSEKYSKINQQNPMNSYNSDQIGILLTPGRNVPQSENIKSSILEESENCIKSTKNNQSSVNEGENSSIRRSNDWRVKLLNKRCSLQATPYRAATP
ncbi:uncharacterized protein cubi_00542 [Cryptosporidium ubiquitum]|uniref:Uncharacterized protein n=1 Tax=Cryptosporidium ubiquitum TaxID=857276 RepID=A0A1J4MCN5_9CRYT|nr:uncharacterized protein cubi_00542 [Cryptosporidium ubiquitum]OII71735.1 hypothetical protein cubi_00542 [Cryptosporidium ubiquitum]